MSCVIDEQRDICIVYNPIIESVAKSLTVFLTELQLSVFCITTQTNDPRSSNNTVSFVDYHSRPAKWYILIGHIQSTTYPEHYIVWQIEQLSSPHITEEYLQLMRNASYVWHFAPRSLQLTPSQDDFETSWVVPFLYTRWLGDAPTTYKSFSSGGSLLFYGALNRRRKKILHHLKQSYGDRLRIRTVFGEELYNEIRNAAVVINLHYYPRASLEIARFNEVLQCRVPIVSECGEPSDVVHTASYSPDTVCFVPVVNDDLSNIDMLHKAIEHTLCTGRAVPQPALDKLEANSRYQVQRALFPLQLSGFPFAMPVHHTHYHCLHLPETPYRIEAFVKQPHALLPDRYAIIAGIKATPGWRGCGLSYYNLIWNAKRCNLPYIVIFEDDCEFPNHFKATFDTIMRFLASRKNDWNIFNGCIASLPSDSTIHILPTYENIQFVQVDKMLSTVFNIYHQSVYDKILQWDIHTQSSDNTIDQFIKNIPHLKIITTHPFLFRCLDVKSTLWGRSLYEEYNLMFERSNRLIKKALTTPADNYTHNDDEMFMQEDTYCIQMSHTTRYIQKSRCRKIHSNQYSVDDNEIGVLKKHIKCPRIVHHSTNRPKINYSWYRKAYSLSKHTKCSNYYYQHGLTNGHITHVNQIHKYYPEAKCTVTPHVRIELNNVVYDSIHQFVNQKMDVHQLCEQCELTQNYVKFNHTSNRETIIAITSTDDQICLQLLMCCNVLLLQQEKTCDLCICYLRGIKHPKTRAYLKQLNKCNVFMYHYSKNVGSDIIPFYMLYKRLFDTDEKNYSYIVKLHTKTNTQWRLNATHGLIQFLCTKKWKKELDPYCGASTLVNEFDNYNKRIIENEFSLQFSKQHTFSAGTFFIMKKQELDTIFNNKKVQHLLQCSAICGCYYDNISAFENSPIHTIERLFGYLPAEQNTPLKSLPNNYASDIHLLILIATHANTDIKKKAIVSNHHFIHTSIYAKYKADIIYIHSEECERLHNTQPELLDNKCGRCDHYYITNNHALLDSHKWLYGLDTEFHREDYSHIVLLNDSFILLRPVPELFDFFVTQQTLTGLLKSTEIQLHIQSFFRCLPADLVPQYIQYIDNHKEHVTDYNTNVLQLEVKICEQLKPTWAFDSPDNMNIHFNDAQIKHYVYNLNYPCLKIKWVWNTKHIKSLACAILEYSHILHHFEAFVQPSFVLPEPEPDPDTVPKPTAPVVSEPVSNVPKRLLVIIYVHPNSQQAVSSVPTHLAFFQFLHQRYQFKVDLCMLVPEETHTLHSMQHQYDINPKKNNIHNVSVLQYKEEIQINEFADQVLYRMQKQRVMYYTHVCLMSRNVCFTEEVFDAFELSDDTMVFPFTHESTPSATTTSFASIPSSVMMTLSHFPIIISDTVDHLYAPTATPPYQVLIVLFIRQAPTLSTQKATQSHYRLFHHLQQQYQANVDLCILSASSVSTQAIKEVYNTNVSENIHNVSILQCPPEIDMHTFANQVLHRIQKHHIGLYSYICLLNFQIRLKDTFFETLQLSTNAITFPFLHRENTHRSLTTAQGNPTVSTAFALIPLSILMKLAYFPLTIHALDYTPHPYTLMQDGVQNARHTDARVEENVLYSMC